LTFLPLCIKMVEVMIAEASLTFVGLLVFVAVMAGIVFVKHFTQRKIKKD